MAGGPAAVANGPGYQHLIKNAKPWWKNTRLIILNLWIVLLLLTSSTRGYDGSMMNGLQSLGQWESSFHNPSGGKLGIMSASLNIGVLLSCPFVPYFTDGFGRRAAVFLGALIMCGATILQTASTSVGMFIGARILLGFGQNFAEAGAPLLVTELAHPAQRAQFTSVYNSIWYAGSIIAAWVTFGTLNYHSSWAWRIPSALQALPSVLQVLLIWFVPESPRWLVSKGREAEALKVLAYYHAEGNEQDPLVCYEFEEIKYAIEKEEREAVGWISLFTTPGNRRRLRIIVALAIFAEWSGNGLVSYYIGKVLDTIGVTNPTTQLLINGILNIFNFIVAMVAGLLCDRVGRRPLFLISTIGMTVFWTVQTICLSLYSESPSKVPGIGPAIIVMIFLYYAFYDIAFTPLIVSYTVEILPYALRAKGFMVYNVAISASSLFNQYVNPIALQNIGWKYYLVYLFWLAFEVVFVYFYVVETKNRTLEETSFLFDGPDSTALKDLKDMDHGDESKDLKRSDSGGKV